MKTPKQIIETAINQKRTVLSEYESKQFLSAYQIPVTKEYLVNTESELIHATNEIGYPVVLKGSADNLIHKTEQNLVRVDIRNDDEAGIAFKDITGGLNGTGGAVLVQELIKGQRELVIGMTRDRQFGVSVMFGLGGIFTEILEDVSFRLAPLDKTDTLEKFSFRWDRSE
jgi:acyl-CoA synthetase (NDP forming)